jgi:hypothetical protein
MCISIETWPGSGSVATNVGYSYGVYLLVDNVIYAYKDSEYPGECLEGSCFNALRPGAKIEGFFTYSDFGLPEGSYAQRKELRYQPQPYWCHF